MKRIDLVYFNAGGGHRAAAQALQAVTLQQRRPWQLRMLNLFEVLDPQGRFQRLTGLAPEDYYNKRLQRGWTLGLAQELKLLQGMIRLGHATLLRPLAAHWRATTPDLVVSLVPNFNRVMAEALATARPGVSYVTVMTDLADLPPSFWIEPEVDQHLVCGTAHAAMQALAAGVPTQRVHRSSGMILRPDFYGEPPPDRRAERERLGFDAEQPIGVVLFGGHGSALMRDIARDLSDTPLILLCGHNEALRQALQAMPAAAPRLVVGHTTDMARHLRLADFFIGKPGPGSVSEALHCGLPVIVTRNAWTMPQERYNTDWVQQQRVGRVLRSFAEVRAAVHDVVARLSELRANVQRLDNRAVFEVPEILAALLAGDSAPASCASRGAVMAAT